MLSSSTELSVSERLSSEPNSNDPSSSIFISSLFSRRKFFSTFWNYELFMKMLILGAQRYTKKIAYNKIKYYCYLLYIIWRSYVDFKYIQNERSCNAIHHTTPLFNHIHPTTHLKYYQYIIPNAIIYLDF